METVESNILLILSKCIVPLFGDVAISIQMILSRAPHWNKSKYDMNYADEEAKNEFENSYLLINQFEEISGSYKAIIAELQIFKNQLAKNADPANMRKICYETSLKAVKYLSFLTTKVIEQAAWKYLNPSKSEDPQIGIYEKVNCF